MAKALSSALTSLLIVIATICSSIYLLAIYMPMFDSITDDTLERHATDVDIVSIRENGSHSEILVYNLGKGPIHVTEVLFDNVTVSFVVRFANNTSSLGNILPPEQLSIIIVGQPFSQHQTVYLRSHDQIIKYYVKGR
ncbi:MAG: hypothetical protein ACUVQ8_02130 [Nitrososphaeria archaeon]